MTTNALKAKIEEWLKQQKSQINKRSSLKARALKISPQFQKSIYHKCATSAREYLFSKLMNCWVGNTENEVEGQEGLQVLITQIKHVYLLL